MKFQLIWSICPSRFVKINRKQQNFLTIKVTKFYIFAHSVGRIRSAFWQKWLLAKHIVISRPRPVGVYNFVYNFSTVDSSHWVGHVLTTPCGWSYLSLLHLEIVIEGKVANKQFITKNEEYVYKVKRNNNLIISVVTKYHDEQHNVLFSLPSN